MAGTLSQGREQTSKVWAALSPHRSLWNHPFLERHIDHRVGAPTGRNWVQHMHAELLGGAPFKRALAIGCGLGAADRSLHL
jgi:hypothetical protein